MKARAIKHTLLFKRPSGTSRGVLTEKDTYFLVLEKNSFLLFFSSRGYGSLLQLASGDVSPPSSPCQGHFYKMFFLFFSFLVLFPLFFLQFLLLLVRGTFTR